MGVQGEGEGEGGGESKKKQTRKTIYEDIIAVVNFVCVRCVVWGFVLFPRLSTQKNF